MKTTQTVEDPIIVNIGHRISLDSAVEIVKNVVKTRVPEPV